MVKRYDYHSISEQCKVAFLVLPLTSLLVLYFLMSGQHSISESMFVIAFLAAGNIVGVISYLELSRTFFEVSDNGILFHGWRKQIFSPWAEVRKIKAIIRSYKIYTDRGSFSIGRVEPAEMKSQSLLQIAVTDRALSSNELIEIIKKNAPHAKEELSMFNRPL